ncbi:hypothetical protein ACXO8F_08400 [Lactobacillus delbrueckii subsp. bulgaricus]
MENRSQSDFLKEIGCQYQQGYLFAASMQLDELRQFLGKAGDQLEDISLSDYYSQIDRVNVLSDPQPGGTEFQPGGKYRRADGHR